MNPYYQNLYNRGTAAGYIPGANRGAYNTRVAGLQSGMPSDPNQAVAYAMANHVAPGALGLSNQQINYGEQGNMGSRWNPQTGQMESTTGQPYMANAGNGGGAYTGGQQGDMTGAGVNWGGGANAAVSNLGGGAGNPNNAAGGLYGAAGNAIRQQMMGSSQFNPNGANTYAIQNMNLSGQGDLGSNMGGLPSNGITTSNSTYPTQTAQGSGQTTGQPLATAGMGTSPVSQQQYNTNSGTATGMTPSYFPSSTSAYSGGSGWATQQQGLRSGVVRQ